MSLRVLRRHFDRMPIVHHAYPRGTLASTFRAFDHLLVPVRPLVQLEDCSDQEEDKTRNGRNYSDDMERPPAIAKLLPVARQR